MSSNYTLDNGSRSSDFDDGIETISANANLLENHSRSSTPECLWGCTMRCDHGPGPHVYSCKCNRHLIHVLEKFKQPTRGQDGGLEGTGESRRKRKISGDDNTPRIFGHDMSNRRATSLPIIELPPKKRRRIGRNFVLCEEELLEAVMQEVAGVHNAMSKIEAIFNRQNSVLLEICNTIGNHGIVDALCGSANDMTKIPKDQDHVSIRKRLARAMKSSTSLPASDESSLFHWDKERSWMSQSFQGGQGTVIPLSQPILQSAWLPPREEIPFQVVPANAFISSATFKS
ncbi:hypothetical protein EV424DRAFT_1350978 [Suillus variegatus]|nr:hypothetical protein EV424DRAFT_1350978 [Suillus variegatus]